MSRLAGSPWGCRVLISVPPSRPRFGRASLRRYRLCAHFITDIVNYPRLKLGASGSCRNFSCFLGACPCIQRSYNLLHRHCCRRSNGQLSQSFGKDITSCAYIPIVFCLTAGTYPPSHRQSMRLSKTTVAAELAGGVETAHQHQLPRPPERLILQLSAEFTQRCICPGLGMPPQLGSRKGAQIQILDADHIMPLHQTVG